MRWVVGLLVGAAVFAAEPSWGVADNGLRMGLSISSGMDRSVIVSLENSSAESLTILVGGRSGIGPLYSFTFLSANAAGQECTLFNTMAGAGVAGYVEPMVFKLRPGAIETVTIPTAKLICSQKGTNRGLEELFAAGYSVKVVFKSAASAEPLHRLEKLWTGNVESGALTP